MSKSLTSHEKFEWVMNKPWKKNKKVMNKEMKSKLGKASEVVQVMQLGDVQIMNKLWWMWSCQQIMTKSGTNWNQVVIKKNEQLMNNSWTSHDQVVKKSWTSYEQVMNKAWTSHAKV